jgi:hypothetical protein
MNHHAIPDALLTLALAVTVPLWPGIDAFSRYPVLGIPVAALTAAMLGSGFSYLKRKGQDVEAVPLRLLGIAADAFIGGWIAVALTHIPQLSPYGMNAIPVEAVAGLAAFLMQVVRIKAADYFERIFQAGLNAWVAVFTRGKSRNEDTP